MNTLLHTSHNCYPFEYMLLYQYLYWSFSALIVAPSFRDVAAAVSWKDDKSMITRDDIGTYGDTPRQVQ